MEETLLFMKNILTGKENTLSEKELIILYQDNLYPNILAYFYCLHYGVIYKISKRFNFISDEDKASFCLQVLDECLQKYTGDIKFISFFSTCYKYKLIAEYNLLLYDKRISNLNCIDYDTIYAITGDDIDFEDIDIVLSNYNLTKNEKLHCKLLFNGYSQKQLAKLYNISPAAVSQRNLKIKQKILNAT